MKINLPSLCVKMKYYINVVVLNQNNYYPKWIIIGDNVNSLLKNMFTCFINGKHRIAVTHHYSASFQYCHFLNGIILIYCSWHSLHVLFVAVITRIVRFRHYTYCSWPSIHVLFVAVNTRIVRGRHYTYSYIFLMTHL